MKKVISLLLIFILIILFLLMVFRKIDPLYFWIGTAIIAILAYKVIPFIVKGK